MAERDALSECSYWRSLARGFQTHYDRNEPSVEQSSDESAEEEEELRYAAFKFDTSPGHCEGLHAAWAGGAQELSQEVLRAQLERQYGVRLSSQALREALDRAHGAGFGGGGGAVSLPAFASLWQKLVLGAVYNHFAASNSEMAERNILVTTYRDSVLAHRKLTEYELVFGGIRWSGGEVDWVRIDHSGPDRLERLGVAFFLHPLAIEDAVDAANDERTKVERNRHQYFVSLEVYGLKSSHSGASSMSSSSSWDSSEECTTSSGTDSRWSVPKVNFRGSPMSLIRLLCCRSNPLGSGAEPPRVKPRVGRSYIFLVATVLAPTRNSIGYRDWLLSIINTEQRRRQDPLARFANRHSVARKLLNQVSAELRAYGEVRDHKADFLLYKIVDRAADNLSPITRAYGHRLRWLQAQAESSNRRVSDAHVEEVSSMRLEFKELLQWVSQMKSLLNHLETDVKQVGSRVKKLMEKDSLFSADVVAQNFGAWDASHDKEMTLFLHDTNDSLLEQEDRLAVLDKLAKQFDDDAERRRDYTMNKILYVLTVATVVFMPSQLMAGCYGMNFVEEDGEPGIPELLWPNGYYMFLVVNVLTIMILTVLAVIFLRY